MKQAFLFPGQGAQYPGMGKDFFESFQLARETLEEADEILKHKLSHIILHGPENVLTETKHSQAGIYVISIAIFRVIQKQFPKLKPNICSGLSLGEYTALACAGYLSFEDGLRLVQLRGRYMNDACEAVPGTMAVVLGLDAAAVEEIVKQVDLPNELWAANFNCPGQVVISGTLKGIQAGAKLAQEKGAKRVLPLQVHGAFHSGLMQQAQERLAEHILAVQLKKKSAEIVMNVTGKTAQNETEIKDNLIKQVTSPVRWEQGIRFIEKEQVHYYFELGPGNSLSGFNKRIGVKAPTISIGKVEDFKTLEHALKGAA